MKNAFDLFEIKIIDKLNEAFSPKNIECDGAFCTGCWKDVVREAIRMVEEINILEKKQEEKIVNEPYQCVAKHKVRLLSCEHPQDERTYLRGQPFCLLCKKIIELPNSK